MINRRSNSVFKSMLSSCENPSTFWERSRMVVSPFFPKYYPTELGVLDWRPLHPKLGQDFPKWVVPLVVRYAGVGGPLHALCCACSSCCGAGLFLASGRPFFWCNFGIGYQCCQLCRQIVKMWHDRLIFLLNHQNHISQLWNGGDLWCHCVGIHIKPGCPWLSVGRLCGRVLSWMERIWVLILEFS